MKRRCFTIVRNLATNADCRVLMRESGVLATLTELCHAAFEETEATDAIQAAIQNSNPSS